jgi:D-alanyl-D-alanine carboxypeptidase (penicillin-binding protein 5/6)
VFRPAPAARVRAGVLALLTGAALLLAGAPSALAAPSRTATPSPRPTADLSAPTPTSPPAGPPPQGSAPDGSTVGGERLDTRGLVVADGAPPLPDGVAAAGWLVADAGTGQVLAARDPHGRYYPASTLKTLLLLTLAPLLSPDTVVAGTTEDENIEGSRVGIVNGGSYSVALLYRALMLQSGNDAANALARTAGGVPQTVAAMQQTADRLGAFDTVVGTPSGLDVAGQSSSPYDLALIFRQLVADPATAAVLMTTTADMPAVGDKPAFQIQNQDPLLGTYPGNLGAKSGFTDAARHTFVTAAERDGRRIVVSLMQTERRPVPEAQQAALLLDWGFSVPAGATGVGRLVEPGEVPATPPPAPSTTATTSSRPAAAPAARSASTTHAAPGWLAAGAVVLLVAVLGVVLSLRRRNRPGSAPPPG